MNKKSWAAMTGLCVLLATSAAQAYVIPICVDAYESGIQVSGAVAGATLPHVTFTQAGPQSPAAGQTGSGKAAPYWSASSDSIGSCLQRTDSYSSSRAERQEVSLDQTADFIRFDATNPTHSPWTRAFDADSPSALTPVQTFNQALGQQVMLSSAAGNIGRMPGHTFNQAGRPSVTSSSEAGNIGRVPMQTSNRNQALGQPSATPSSAAGNPSSAPTPVQTIDQALDQPSATQGSAAANTGDNPIAGDGGHSIVGDPGNNDNVTTVPESETLALLMIGLVGMALTTRRRRTPG